jgi:multiple sugar transport system substrate-binding protein
MVALKRRSPQTYGVLLPLNEFEPLLALALQQQTPLLRDGDRYGNFRSPEFRRTLQFYLDIFKSGWAPRVSNTQISNVWDEFGNGFYSFYISGPWNIGEFKRRLPADKQGIWMTAPLPGPNGPGASSAGGSSLVVFERSRHKDEAWQVIEYLSQPSVQLRFYEMTGNLPPRRSAWTDPKLARDQYAAAFRDQLERAKSPPKVPEWERIATELRLVTEAAVAGQLTVDQAVTELDARADRILEKRRWMMKHGGAL